MNGWGGIGRMWLVVGQLVRVVVRVVVRAVLIQVDLNGTLCSLKRGRNGRRKRMEYVVCYRGRVCMKQDVQPKYIEPARLQSPGR